MDTGQNPQLGIEPLRESCLETLNNFASRIEVATKKVCSALARAADDMACFWIASKATKSYKQQVPLSSIFQGVCHWIVMVSFHNVKPELPWGM